MAGGNFAGGNGTKGSPYLVEDAHDLSAVKSNLTAHYLQVADINLAGFGSFSPIGEPVGSSIPGFEGVYDGGGHKIVGLYIREMRDIQATGLFGEVEGVVERVNLENVNVTKEGDAWAVGGIAGWLGTSGIIRKCSVTGTIKNVISRLAGGITAVNDGLIEDCWVNATVEGGGSIGLIAGSNQGTMRRCHARGLLRSLNTSYRVDHMQAGVLAGIALGPILDSVALPSTIIRSEGNSPYFGRITGYPLAELGNNSAYNITFSGGTFPNFDPSLDGKDGQTISAADAKAQSTYEIGKNWNFTKVWTIDPEINAGYPFLFYPPDASVMPGFSEFNLPLVVVKSVSGSMSGQSIFAGHLSVPIEISGFVPGMSEWLTGLRKAMIYAKADGKYWPTVVTGKNHGRYVALRGYVKKAGKYVLFSEGGD